MPKPAGYYNALFGGTPDEVLRLFEKYPVHPPDDADGYQGDSVRKIGDVRFTGEGLDAGDIDVANVDPTKPVAWLNFFKNRKTAKDLQVGNEGAHTLIASASYTANAAHVPAYFLPWNTAGAVISLTIPRRGTRAGHLPDPDIFFTAAINGCSVFFDADSPITRPSTTRVARHIRRQQRRARNSGGTSWPTYSAAAQRSAK